MKFLNHLNLVENELRYAKMFRTPNGSYQPGGGSGPAGNIIMDTTDDIPKWWDGGAWRDFSYGTTGTMNWNIQSDSGSNIQVDQGDILDLTGGTGISTVTSGSASAPLVTFNLQPATTSVLGGVIAGTNVSITAAGTISVPNNTNTTYSMMTATVLGLGKLEDNTTQTTSANTVTATEGRTYGIQKNSDNQLVVNVPWADTNTNTTYTVGAGLTSIGTEFSHDDTSTQASISNPSTRTYIQNVTLDTYGHVTALATATETVVNTNTQRAAGVGMTLNTNTLDVNTWGAISGTLNATTGDASGKYYKVHTDANDKLIVNVPWQNTQTTNTDANYALSVGAVSSNESTLSLVGSSGGSTTTAKFSGTTNEIEITTPSTGNGGDVTIGLPNDVTIGNDLAVTNDLTVTGDLTVNGTTTTVNSNTVEIGDAIITLNSDETGTPSQNAGIEIERGTSTNRSLLWNETTDKWSTYDGSTYVPVIQNVFTTATGDSGTASANSTTTALALTGANGITTTGASQGMTISGGTGNTPSKVVTINSTSLNSSTNKLATLTHNLGTKDIIVRLYEMEGEGAYSEIYANVSVTSTNACTVQFSANLSVSVRAVIVAARYAGAATIAYS
jgi:hypothetical protein